MKKIFTLIAAAFMAVGAYAQTAKDAYLDITQYATLTDDDINIKGATDKKVYSWNETKKALIISAYVAQQTAQKTQDAGKTGYGWVTYNKSNSATASWSATGDFNGSTFYGSTVKGLSPGKTSGTDAGPNVYSFYVTNCVKVSALIHSKKSDKFTTMDVYPVTFDGTTPTRGTLAGTTSDKSNSVTTISVENLDATKIYEVVISSEYTSGAHLYELAFYNTATVTPPTAATTWDFTQELSTADATNLTADATNWTYDTENGYYKNAAKLADRNVYISLKANNVELDITKGLTFARDNSEGIGADRVRIAPGKYIAVYGSANLISLGELAKNDIIRMKFKGGGESERNLTVTNATVTKGSLTTADTDEHEVTLQVDKDGEVIFRTSNGFNFYSIAINAALPTGITDVKVVEPSTVKDDAIYNLSGQKVNKNYKGVVIKNGVKTIQK